MNRSAPRLASMILLALATLFAIPWTAHADCSDYPNNLLAAENCDADVDAFGWRTVVAPISHESTDGVPPGAVRVDGVDDGKGFEALVALCAPGTEQTTYSFGAAARAVAGAPNCNARVVRYANADCTGPNAFTNKGVAFYPNGLSEWRFESGKQTLNLVPGLSAELRITCSSPSPFTFLVDNAYLLEGDQSVPFFFDGFENGDLEHWSAASP